MFIRVYAWTPFVGQTLLLSPEVVNEEQPYAVSVLKDAAVVGHAPRELSRLFFSF